MAERQEIKKISAAEAHDEVLRLGRTYESGKIIDENYLGALDALYHAQQPNQTRRRSLLDKE